MRAFIFLISICFAAPSNAVADKIKEMESIKKNVMELCQAPSDKGKFMDVKVSGGGEASVKLLKILGNTKLSTKATFDKGEWEGVQRVLQSQQAFDNETYRRCVEKLTPLFVKKFVKASPQNEKTVNKNFAPKTTNDNKTVTGNTNIKQDVPTAHSQTMINSPGAIQAINSNVYVRKSVNRRLNNEQRDIFVQYLKNNPKGSVRIYLFAHGSEPSDYADDLLAALKESGWNASKSSVIPAIPTTAKGIGILFNQELTKSDEAYYLQQAFDKIQVKALAEIDNSRPKDLIVLAIFNNPE